MAKKQESKVTWAQAVRDVLIRSMEKGQGPLFLFGLVTIVIFLKMPSEKVGEMFDGGRVHWWLGWVLFVISLFGWGVHAKADRKRHAEELDRVGREKNELQKRTLGSDVKSSQE